MKKGMMISCEEATQMVVKAKFEKFSWYDKFRLKMHLAMCKFCALFAKQNAFIDEKVTHIDQHTHTKLPTESKMRIVEEISK
ncbi:MAG: hypothetical protein K9G76_08650 [Bacteroidales bacterium]|nr:hypothetical protein [Bacteroidales bacterium]MCF8404435.1 hypothetical protein [Bacteroidales bacterium]